MTKAESNASIMVVGIAAVLVLPGLAHADLLGVPLATAGPWGAWTQDLVDDSHTVNPGTSLAIDSDDSPHIAYWTTGGVAYAVKTGSTWTRSIIPWTSGSPGPTSRPSLALDTDDGAHVCAQDAGNGGKLAYSSYVNGSWVSEWVDTSPETGSNCALRMESSDAPHIAYRDRGTLGQVQLARYAYKNETGWHIETINTSYHTGGPSIGMAFGPDGTIHVTWLTSGTGFGSLVYAHRAVNGTWTSEVISSNSGGFDHSLAVDSQGRPHISFDKQSAVLGYAYNNGTAWTITDVDTDARTGQSNSIAVDANDVPHISYVQHDNFDANDVTRGHVKYATKVAGQWFTEFADPQDKNAGTSITLDSHGRPRVAYQYWIDQDLVNGATSARNLKYAETLQSNLP